MFQTLLICFREGLEALLVVAIATLYLRKTGRLHLLMPLRAGVVVAALLSVVLGWVLSQVGAMSPAAEGVMALVAAAAVAWCVVHMRSAGKGMGQDIAQRMDRASILEGPRAWAAVFLFALFMVGREGVETATMLAALARSAELAYMAWGGVAGLALAIAIAWAWTRYGRAVNLARFFQVTSWFMAVFAVQLVIYALHEFTEGGLVPGIDNAWWHANTEDLAEGTIAQAISLALVLVPTVWLGVAQWRDRQHNAGTVSAQPGPSAKAL
ncbi:FTR1 family protein [Acidovorax sp. LjRoot129]|uniref:FTR1 family protein n=1 Tax=Acidovorax sp. LjRoot129 TaxID=3342260 RepID=UPI003ECC629C